MTCNAYRISRAYSLYPLSNASGSKDKVVIISQTKETTIKHHTIDGKSSLRVRPKAEETVDH